MVVLQDKPIAMPRPFGGDPPTITISERSDGKPGRYITVQITGPIVSMYQYLEFIQVLDAATRDDKIDVVIDTPGGCVFTTQLLVERMNSSKATVTAVAGGLVASAGTFLWFFSKHRDVREWSTFMFHSSSHGDFGKSLAIQETSTEMVNYMQNTVKAMIEDGILTRPEASRIFRQKKDLFLPGSIIRARMLAEMSATEGLSLRDGDAGEYPDPDSGTDAVNDRPDDPDGNPDEHANDDLDGKKTEIDVAAIFAAEGVEIENQPAENQELDENGNPVTDRCGRKGKKKAKKRRAKADGEEITTDENGDPIQTDEGAAGTGDDDNPEGKKRRKAAKKRRAKAQDGDDAVEPPPDGAETVDPDDDQAVADAPASAYLKW